MKRLIYRNVISYTQTLLQQSRLFGYQLQQDNFQHEQTIRNIGKDQIAELVDVSPEIFDALKALWKDPISQETMGRYREFQLIDSAP